MTGCMWAILLPFVVLCWKTRNKKAFDDLAESKLQKR